MKEIHLNIYNQLCELHTSLHYGLKIESELHNELHNELNDEMNETLYTMVREAITNMTSSWESI